MWALKEAPRDKIASTARVVSTPDSTAASVGGSQFMAEYTIHIMYYPQIASRDLDDTYPGILGAKVIQSSPGLQPR